MARVSAEAEEAVDRLDGLLSGVWRSPSSDICIRQSSLWETSQVEQRQVQVKPYDLEKAVDLFC